MIRHRRTSISPLVLFVLNRCSLFNRGKILSLWCPQADDGYVALGCVYKASGCAGWLTSHADPPSGAEVWGLVTLRADLAAPGRVASVPVWAKKGSSEQAGGRGGVLSYAAAAEICSCYGSSLASSVT